jgi:hypothetical protein
MHPKMVERTPQPGPFHEPNNGGGKEEDRPHPGLLPQEKESLFPRLVNLRALSLRWFRGSMREFFGEFFSLRKKRSYIASSIYFDPLQTPANPTHCGS